MHTREEIDSSCAAFFKSLRLSMGLSKVRMADKLDINRKRWAAYENGEAQPTISEYFWICQSCGTDPVKPMLEFYSPEVYKGLRADSRISAIRQAASHYMLNVATNSEMRSWQFQTFGSHGSDPRAQQAECDMLNQLSMGQKFIIAEMIDAFWSLDKERGDLRCTDEIEPDVEYFRRALEAGRTATIEGRDGYTGSGGRK